MVISGYFGDIDNVIDFIVFAITVITVFWGVRRYLLSQNKRMYIKLVKRLDTFDDIIKVINEKVIKLEAYIEEHIFNRGSRS